jgi:hypothetical protein
VQSEADLARQQKAPGLPARGSLDCDATNPHEGSIITVSEVLHDDLGDVPDAGDDADDVSDDSHGVLLQLSEFVVIFADQPISHIGHLVPDLNIASEYALTRVGGRE